MYVCVTAIYTTNGDRKLNLRKLMHEKRKKRESKNPSQPPTNKQLCNLDTGATTNHEDGMDPMATTMMCGRYRS